MLAEDYRDMLIALNEAGAEYLIVGAYALAAHGHVRATGDIDIWIRPTVENARRVWSALGAFRAPRSGLRVEDLSTPDVVYQIGVAPCRIDFLTSLSGIEFQDAWENRVQANLGDLPIPVLGCAELLRNKRAAGRPKDLADVAWLEEHLK